MANPILQSSAQNILREATWSGTAPSPSYALTTFGLKNPAARVAFASGTTTITATVASAAGAVVAVPVTNADTLTLTNGAGLSVAVPLPTMPIDGHPLTAVFDFTASGNLTSTVWNFVFTKASGTLLVGGALLVFGPLTQFADWSWQWGGRTEIQPFGVDHRNQYGTRYLQDFQTIQRTLTLQKIATPDERAQYEAWFRGNGMSPGLIWPDPDINDAVYGTVQSYRSEQTAPYFAVDDAIYTLDVAIEELSKGKPV